MRVERLYSLRISYTGLWEIGEDRFGIMEGRCEGRVTGSFTGSNHARIRADGGYLPHVEGVIETEDGARLLLDLHGRGRVDANGDFAATGTVTHVSDDPRYERLNHAVCALEASSGVDEESIALVVYEIVGGAAPS